MNYVRATALASSLLLTLSACGGGGASPEDAALTDAVVAKWTADETFPPGFSIDCAAEGFVSGMGGSEGAAAYGVTPESIADDVSDDPEVSEADARSMVGNMFDCDGFEAAILGQFGGEATEEQTICLADNVDDEPLVGLLASSFMGDGGAALEEEFENVFEADLMEAVESCGLGG